MLHESHIEKILDHTYNLVPYCVFAHFIVRPQAVDPQSHLLINFKYAEKCSQKVIYKLQENEFQHSLILNECNFSTKLQIEVDYEN